MIEAYLASSSILALCQSGQRLLVALPTPLAELIHWIHLERVLVAITQDKKLVAITLNSDTSIAQHMILAENVSTAIYCANLKPATDLYRFLFAQGRHFRALYLASEENQLKASFFDAQRTANGEMVKGFSYIEKLAFLATENSVYCGAREVKTMACVKLVGSHGLTRDGRLVSFYLSNDQKETHYYPAIAGDEHPCFTDIVSPLNNTLFALSKDGRIWRLESHGLVPLGNYLSCHTHFPAFLWREEVWEMEVKELLNEPDKEWNPAILRQWHLPTQLAYWMATPVGRQVEIISLV